MPGLCFSFFRGPRLLSFPESTGTCAFSFFKNLLQFSSNSRVFSLISSNLCGFVREQWYFIVDWLLINSSGVPMLGPLCPGLPCCSFRPSPGLNSLSSPASVNGSICVPRSRSQRIAILPCLPEYPLPFWLAKIVPHPTPVLPSSSLSSSW